jgi:hypothetical protein
MRRRDRRSRNQHRDNRGGVGKSALAVHLRYLEIRYEDLAVHSRETTQRITRFLGID